MSAKASCDKETATTSFSQKQFNSGERKLFDMLQRTYVTNIMIGISSIEENKQKLSRTLN